MPKFDLYGLPDHQWTARKRRSLFRRRRVEHLAALESEKSEADRLRVVATQVPMLSDGVAMTLGTDLGRGDASPRL
jgi:hypothetical protein